MNLRLLLFSLLTLVTITNIHGQDRCGSDALMEELLQDPDYYEQFQQKLARAALFQDQINVRMECDNMITLPVAIHFQNVINPDRTCLEQLAQNQIQTVNQDFQGLNPDIATWDANQATFFPGIQNGEACIQFCIATQNHPPGFGLSDGDLAVTINQFSNSFNSAWSGYINIFVRDFSFLGSSPLGGNGNGDGVNIDKQAFGTSPNCGDISPSAPYNLGRTLTHEFGHYFLLSHIWGADGCGNDDSVSDTPVSDDEYFGCPAIGASSCGSNDMHMNYMDYTNDACMYVFSAGQVTRMENYINSSLLNVVNNAANVCGELPTSCSDGIQNGNETGIDCGGPDCAPCDATADCTDGIQNGDETGVDCGGADCPACPGGCAVHTLEIRFDLDYTQITWTLTNDDNEIFAEGGPYLGAGPFNTVTESFCLPDDCYTFSIFDSGGNGLCCSRGRGFYSLSGPDGSAVATGSAFGSVDITEFCVDDAPVATCTDGVQNGNETGIDCGGPDCPACPPVATCDDGVQNGNETGIDCGGPDCPACPPVATCDDGVQNGNETGIDCGGPDCPACPPVATCDDGVQNGNETGIDCGGPDCPACPPVATCDDGIQNGNETGIDCGGPDCPACEELSCGPVVGETVTFLSIPTVVLVSWDAVQGASLYEIRYRLQGSNIWATIPTFSTSRYLSRLQTGTTYEYQIRAFCSSSGWSDYTSNNFTTNSFRAADGAIEFELELSSLYPNPARDQLMLELATGAVKEVTIRVYDVLGREVRLGNYVLEVGENKIRLDLSSLSGGFHLLSIQDGKSQIVKGFIKE